MSTVEYADGLGKTANIKVVHTDETPEQLAKEHLISENDAEMDKRAVEAVKAAIAKAKICGKPIARYDADKKKAYIEYADGGRKYFE